MAGPIDPGHGYGYLVPFFAAVATVISALVGALGLYFGNAIHSRVGALEQGNKDQDTRIDGELRSRRETISQLERDQAMANARTEAMLASEREARKELESRMQNQARESEARIVSALREASGRWDTTAQTIFTKLEAISEKVGQQNTAIAQLKGEVRGHGHE